MKGYKALVGFDINKGGMFALFQNEDKARKWVKDMIKLHLTINPQLKAEGKIEVMEVKKCDISYCDKLVENDGRLCLSCEAQFFS